VRIAWVGGVGRQAGHLVAEAERAGHTVEIHDGRTERRSIGRLRRAIARCDLVVLTTDVNSHGALGAAREAASEWNRPIVLVRTGGLTRLRRVLEEIEGR
jgi:hypothetical protein